MSVRRSELALAEGAISVYRWEQVEDGAEVAVRGVLQLVHGSCEHALRYDRFARYMAEQGWIVYASDLRGHGHSTPQEDLGYFGDTGGWESMVDELHEVRAFIGKQHPELKIVLFGHSMGSFLARHYAIVHGSGLSGLILSGTAHYVRSSLRLGKLLAEREIRSKGIRHRSAVLYNLTYRSFNKRFKPNRTAQDWLSRDEAEVDRFLQDERCGFVFTSGGFRDMFEGLLFITDKKHIALTPKELPVLFISGKDDPVGSFGKTVRQAYGLYRAVGMTNVRLKLYEGMRHELLNEVGKEEVYLDIAEWLISSVK
ncbi:alpha/beta hydrolase [Paenibacillus sp. J5C2022]|uniref:alpha/beta hydrolase n=1 Tax=Paenibacillus sp. J5C2022 TaxID=2977129 RepID=UPI0021CF1472|nr:alpha/beta hydrolase [Paenibacillus sp. J5C2022]